MFKDSKRQDLPVFSTIENTTIPAEHTTLSTIFDFPKDLRRFPVIASSCNQHAFYHIDMFNTTPPKHPTLIVCIKTPSHETLSETDPNYYTSS